MFHRYITGESGQKIDFDRAAWLMDKSLLKEAIFCLPAASGLDEFDFHLARLNGISWPKPQHPGDILQTLWNNYCAAHEQKYGEQFAPDVM